MEVKLKTIFLIFGLLIGVMIGFANAQHRMKTDCAKSGFHKMGVFGSDIRCRIEK